MRFPPEYWVWERWLKRGAPKPRPARLPTPIPKLWRARHLLHVGKPKPAPPASLGVWADSGVQFSNPGTGPLGPVEHMAGLNRNGWGYASFEAFDGNGRKDWSIWHREAERNFLPQRPWAYVRTVADVERLARIALEWQQPPVVNYEIEAQLGTLAPGEVVQALRRYWPGEFCVQTLAILYDSVDWGQLNRAGAVCALEAYVNERPAFADWVYLLERARPDFDRVILSPGMYEFPEGVLPKRDIYASFPAPWLLYLGDNVHDWKDWRAP